MNQHQTHPYFHAPKIALYLALAFASTANATPLLRCEIQYGGETHIMETKPGADPYSFKAQDIGERFLFKAVVIGDENHVDYIKLYAYYQAEHQAVILHETKYPNPRATSDSPYALTGLNYLYSPDLGRELQYGCALVESKP